jgi:tetratricopeptide (TPR) repeat protein
MLETLIVSLPVAFSAVVFTLALVTEPHDLVLQRITAPSVMEDRGYPAETLADLLENKINTIVVDAASMHRPRGLEIDTADSPIDQFTDIMKVGAPVRATQRLLGFVHYIADVSFLELQDQTYRVNLRIRDANSLETLRLQQLHGDQDQVDALLDGVASGIVGFIEPYIMAAYLYNKALDAGAEPPNFDEVLTYIHDRLPSTNPTHRAWFYNLLGKIAEQSDDVDAATEYYQAALNWQPGFPLALINWGHTLAASSQYDQAIERYRAALAIDTSLPIAHLYLAQALLAEGEFKQALAALAQARRLAPDMAAVYELQASLYDDAGMPEFAESERQKARFALLRQPRQRIYEAM